MEGFYSFNGLVDDLRIYNRTFSPAEIQALVQDNSPPVLAPIGSQQTRVGQTLLLNLSATDASGDPLTYSAAPLPSGATIDATSGVFMWSPQINQVGIHSLTFAASNTQLSGSETVAITVIKSNSVPVLKVIKAKRVRAGRRVRIALKAKDRDRDALTYSVDPLPTGATFDPLRRRFEWIPTADQIGQYDLTASVTDGHATSSQPMSIIVY
jgi:hypothetical protein